MKRIRALVGALTIYLTSFLFQTTALATIHIPFDQQTSLGEEVTMGEFTGFFTSFKGLGIAISGICTLTSLIYLILSLTKLSASATNDQARSRALKGVLYSGLSLTLFGGITVIVGVFWNII